MGIHVAGGVGVGSGLSMLRRRSLRLLRLGCFLHHCRSSRGQAAGTSFLLLPSFLPNPNDNAVFH